MLLGAAEGQALSENRCTHSDVDVFHEVRLELRVDVRDDRLPARALVNLIAVPDLQFQESEQT